MPSFTVRQAVLLVMVAVALAAPLLLVDVPPLADYPNHLARVFVLAAWPDDPVLARFYAPHWSMMPNLALDGLAPPLMQVLPVHVAGRLMVALALLLPVAGTIAYAATVHRRMPWWAFAVALAAWHDTLLFGFLNFEIAMGLALLLAAGWLRWRVARPGLALLIGVLGAVALFTCHLMGLVFFGALLAGAELAGLRADPRPCRALLRLAIVFAAPAVLYAGCELSGLGDDAAWLPPLAKLRQLPGVFAGYTPLADAVAAALVLGAPIMAIVLRRGAMPAPAGWAALFVGTAFIAAPFAWKGTMSLDTRFAIMLALVLCAGFRPVRWPRPVAAGAAVLLAGVFAVRMAGLTGAWVAHDADLADLRTALAAVQPGEVLYVAHASADEAPAAVSRHQVGPQRTDEHLGALAVIERGAFYPFLFDNPSQQPIRKLEPYRTLAEHAGGVATRAAIEQADLCGFDAVLLLEADAVPALPSPRFRLRSSAGFAAVYDVLSCKPLG